MQRPRWWLGCVARRLHSRSVAALPAWGGGPPHPSLPPCSVQSAHALTFDELQGLTYLQVKGTGVANTCPTIEGGSSNPKDLKPGAYKLSKFCLEPTSFTVKEESQVRLAGRVWTGLPVAACARDLGRDQSGGNPVDLDS